MEVRNITKEDLPKLAELINCPELATREDICYEHSKMNVNEQGEIRAFVIMREHSLYDYFGGEIPVDEQCKNLSFYYKGMEFDIRRDFAKFQWKHYEIIYWYTTENECYFTLRNCYDGSGYEHVGWMVAEGNEDCPLFGAFYKFNGVVVDIPYTD